MVQVIGENPNSKVSIPIFKTSTAPGVAFAYVSVGTYVVYTDCDGKPGDKYPRMCKIVYGENIGWVYRDSVMTIPNQTLYKLTNEQ